MFNGLKKHCGAPSDAAQYQQGPVPLCLSPCTPHLIYTLLSGIFMLLCQPHVCPKQLMMVLLRSLPASTTTMVRC